MQHLPSKLPSSTTINMKNIKNISYYQQNVGTLTLNQKLMSRYIDSSIYASIVLLIQHVLTIVLVDLISTKTH